MTCPRCNGNLIHLKNDSHHCMACGDIEWDASVPLGFNRVVVMRGKTEGEFQKHPATIGRPADLSPSELRPVAAT